MKNLVLLLSLFALGQAVPVSQFTPVTLYREVSQGVYAAENFTGSSLKYQASDEDVKIFFTSRDHGGMIAVDPNDTKAVNSIGFSPDKDTVFIVHGWKNEFDSPVCETISESVLKAKDVNVFIVDWSKIASDLYLVAFQAVPSIGNILHSLINEVVKNNGLNLDKTFLVGHSLGAHVAGIAGANLKGQVNYIVGLDPALPGFIFEDTDGRLDERDAKFVEVIHTCSGLLGFNRAIGHVDYWPNGGSGQPGCGLDLGGACSHGRSYYYYAESLETGGFLSQKCDNYILYKAGMCKSQPTSFLGQYDIDKQATGDYFLKTNSESPYAEN